MHRLGSAELGIYSHHGCAVGTFKFYFSRLIWLESSIEVPYSSLQFYHVSAQICESNLGMASWIAAENSYLTLFATDLVRLSLALRSDDGVYPVLIPVSRMVY